MTNKTKENLEKKLNVLVVEDRAENREAAQTYFNTRKDVKVDFATNYEQAIQKLNENLYALAILDIEIPRKEGAETERLGLELGKDMEIMNGKYKLPHLFLTAGVFHGGPRSNIYLDEYCVKNKCGESTTGKINPEAWKEAYETLAGIWTNAAELVRSKEYAEESFGKKFHVWNEERNRKYQEIKGGDKK